MPRDLRFAWEEMPQQILDVQAQKVRESLYASLIGWAEAAGGGSDYTDNVPLQCLHPTGHWFEVPNMLRNGTLARLLVQRPQLKYLLLHNIDTLGADLDPGLLGRHIRSEACLSFEVIPRRIDDRGGGLARVNGRVRLVEGLAMPREDDEFKLSYYNSQTTWISIERLLGVFGLSRGDLADESKVTTAVRRLSMKLPTYITLEGREEAVGARPGGHLPRGAIREAVERHDRPCRGGLPVRDCLAAAGAAAQGPRPVGRLAPRRLGGLCRSTVRVGKVAGTLGIGSMNSSQALGRPVYQTLRKRSKKVQR